MGRETGLCAKQPWATELQRSLGHSFQGASFLWGRRQGCQTSAGENNSKLSQSLLLDTDGGGFGRGTP